MGASDPTLEFLAGLNDPALYAVKQNVPAFVPHKRKYKGRDGKVQDIKVTEKDLQEIADNYNRRYEETGTPAAIKLGHVRPDEDEESQPDIVGAATNFKVGVFGPKSKPCLLYTSHLRRDRLDEIKKGGYVFRSPEFYPKLNQITAIALLNRDPELDLGMVAYERNVTMALRNGGALCYSAEVHYMADPTDPPDPNMSAAPPPANPDPEAAESEAYMKHCYSHPYAAKMVAKYAAQAPAMPSPTNGAMPGMPDDKPPMPYAGTDEAMAVYARSLEFRLKRAEQRSARAEQANLLLIYQGELAGLAAEQGLDESAAEEFVAKELPRVQTYSRPQFDAYKEVLADHLSYSRDPTQGAMLPVARSSAKKEMTEARLEEAQTYMRQGMPWAEARAKVLAG